MLLVLVHVTSCRARDATTHRSRASRRSTRTPPRTGSFTTITFARWLVPLVAGVALIFTFRGGDTLVTLLLMGYALVTQLFPSLLAALWPAMRVTAAGAMSGILAGVAVVGGVTLSGTTAATLFPSWPPYITDINIGVLALFVNVTTMFAVSRFARQPAFTPQPV